MTDAEMTESMRQIEEVQSLILDALGESAIGKDGRVIFLACLGAAANVAIALRIEPAAFKAFMADALDMTEQNWPARKPRAANER